MNAKDVVKKFLPPLPGSLGDVQAQKLLDGLAAAGFAVVELPKLKPRGSFGAWAWNATFTEDARRIADEYDSYAHVEVDSDGLVELDTSAENGLFSDEAEAVAAALLATARFRASGAAES